MVSFRLISSQPKFFIFLFSKETLGACVSTFQNSLWCNATKIRYQNSLHHQYKYFIIFYPEFYTLLNYSAYHVITRISKWCFDRESVDVIGRKQSLMCIILKTLDVGDGFRSPTSLLYPSSVEIRDSQLWDHPSVDASIKILKSGPRMLWKLSEIKSVICF